MPRLGTGAYSIAQLEQMLNKCRGERQKLERADVGERIVAVRGVGFRLESPADV